jgi:glycerophosphoryl diester phosphodiesterase
LAALHPARAQVGGVMAGAVAGRAHELGMRVHVWTVNRAQDVIRLAAAGVDGVVTDLPGLEREALGPPG